MLFNLINFFLSLCIKKENLNNDMIFDKINDSKGILSAKKISEKSLSNKKKVGCVIIDNGKIISTGFNQVPKLIKNKECENNNNNTYWYVIHAEADAILKLIHNSYKLNDPIMYTTLSPCKECTKLILQTGIKKIVYNEEYKDTSCIDFLKNANINIYKYLH